MAVRKKKKKTDADFWREGIDRHLEIIGDTFIKGVSPISEYLENNNPDDSDFKTIGSEITKVAAGIDAEAVISGTKAKVTELMVWFVGQYNKNIDEICRESRRDPAEKYMTVEALGAALAETDSYCTEINATIADLKAIGGRMGRFYAENTASMADMLENVKNELEHADKLDLDALTKKCEEFGAQDGESDVFDEFETCVTKMADTFTAYLTALDEGLVGYWNTCMQKVLGIREPQ